VKLFCHIPFFVCVSFINRACWCVCVCVQEKDDALEAAINHAEEATQRLARLKADPARWAELTDEEKCHEEEVRDGGVMVLFSIETMRTDCSGLLRQFGITACARRVCGHDNNILRINLPPLPPALIAPF